MTIFPVFISFLKLSSWWAKHTDIRDLKHSVRLEGVFWTLSNIYDGAFCENSSIIDFRWSPKYVFTATALGIHSCFLIFFKVLYYAPSITSEIVFKPRATVTFYIIKWSYIRRLLQLSFRLLIVCVLIIKVCSLPNP